MVDKAITIFPDEEYFILTGQQTHYLLPEPSVRECPYHEWAHSKTLGVAALPGPITVPSVEARSFFRSGETHHCAHRNVALAKSSEVTAENRPRCGQRSADDGQAFCEIWGFERRLCCRTCAFEHVCTEAQAFRLPCERLVQIRGVAPVTENSEGPDTPRTG